MVNLEEQSVIHRRELDKVSKMSDNLLTIASVEYAYKRLVALPESETMEFIYECEMIVTALAAAYGRLFTLGNGTTRLTPQQLQLPPDLMKAHEQILELRHERYAHHGQHESSIHRMKLSRDGEGVLLETEFRVAIWKDNELWLELILWIRNYVATHVKLTLERISDKSGVTWRQRSGPMPEDALIRDRTGSGGT